MFGKYENNSYCTKFSNDLFPLNKYKFKYFGVLNQELRDRLEKQRMLIKMVRLSNFKYTGVKPARFFLYMPQLQLS